MTTVAIINARLLDPATDHDGPGGPYARLGPDPRRL